MRRCISGTARIRAELAVYNKFLRRLRNWSLCAAAPIESARNNRLPASQSARNAHLRTLLPDAPNALGLPYVLRLPKKLLSINLDEELFGSPSRRINRSQIGSRWNCESKTSRNGIPTARRHFRMFR